MPSTQKQIPQRVSPLLPIEAEYIVEYKDLSLKQRKSLSAVQLISYKGKYEKAASAIGKAVGIDCPTRPGLCNSDKHTQVIWQGPNSWMVVASEADSGRAPGELLASLQKAAGEFAAVVDQSHGRCCLRLGGGFARQVMAKNTAIDLHPLAFAAGQCALTSVAHMNATLVQIDDTPTYDLFVARSLARSFAHVIEQACEEFENED